MPQDAQIYLDYLRIAADFVAIVVFSIGVFFPLKNTIIPYWKKFGRPSTTLLARLTIRVALLVLVIFNILFPIVRLLGYSARPIGWMSAPIYVFLALLYLHSWALHPQRLNGL